MSIQKGFGAIALLIVILSCKGDPLDIDSANVKVNIAYYNMDSIFVHSTPEELVNWNKRFKAEINDAYMYELGVGLRLENDDDSTILVNIANFASDTFMLKFEKRIQEKFPNLAEKHQNIALGFRNLKYHFPKMKMPRSIIFANTVFQSSAFATQDDLMIGVERYLGHDDDLIQSLPSQYYYEWIKEGFEEKYMERDALANWLMTHLVDMQEGNLAENMINWGKILYYTEASFPDKSDDIIIRYSPEDLKWANENEASFWQYLKKEKMLFKTDQDESINILAPGPFTAGLPEKGPDRLGQFLGWKIVRSYMEENEITLEQLFKTKYNKILTAYEID